MLATVVPALIRRLVERRRFVLAVAGVLFATIFAIRQVISGEVETVGLLYVGPISLVALELGLVAGCCAAAFSLGLVAVWSLWSGVDLSLLGFLTRALAYLTVGAVAGAFGERTRAIHTRQTLLLESGLRLAHLDRGEKLSATLARQAQQLVSSRWTRVELSGGAVAEIGVPRPDLIEEQIPIEVRGSRFGSLTVANPAPIGDDDRSTLEILALQAAVAAENWRLLASERERAIIRAELQEARVHLADRAGQLRELIERQEAERHELAYQLKEEAAQSLAAVLLGLAALERELGSGLASPRLGALRSDVDSTLRSLRSLAVGLRPPALELGLRAALERLADTARVRGFGEMMVALEETDDLGEEVETMVYRVVEEALAAVGVAHSVSVRTSPDASELTIEVAGPRHPIARQRLAVLRARMELIGGTLTATETDLRAVIPLQSAEGLEDEMPELQRTDVAL
jgi:signal transduction histidine kinase